MADIANEDAAVVSNALYLHLSVIDPDSVAALSEAKEGRDRQELALLALRIGILSLKAARGAVDGAAIRHAGDRLLNTLEERLNRHREMLDEVLGGALRSYFDPASGAFNERVQRLLKQDGELATVIGSQVESARRTLDELLVTHLGDESALQSLLNPEEGNAFIEAIRGQVSGALLQQSEAIAGEFSLDRPDSALSRLVRELKDRHGDLERNMGERVTSVVGEFSLDNKDSALSRLVGRVEQAQGQISAQFSLDNPESGLTRIVQRLERFETDQAKRSQEFELRVTSMLERIVTRRDDARRSTIHGNEFEQRVGEQLQAHCRIYLRASHADALALEPSAARGLEAVGAWLFGKSDLPVRFFGDLDFAGMQILGSLREVFPQAEAWQPGYAKLTPVLAAGRGHAPEAAGKERQGDPGTTGCRYADSVLLPLMRQSGRFVDQEGFGASEA